MRVAAVVLAAGASTRLGEPKQLVRLGGERLLERAIRMATEAGCDPVIVVLGAHAQLIQRECRLGSASVVLNAEWEEGMSSAIRAGVRALPHGLEGILLMTCDQPAVTGVYLRGLTEGSRAEVVGSRYAGRCGVPAFIPITRFGELESLLGDQGARAMLNGARSLELLGGELDIDDQETLRAARHRFAEQL